ncbi:MAG TPA: hypothetical protein DEG17_06040 [Cyanobacteria bacterium UBA11149]|nr:hypothetical protein [Cyanobacteria bacterium UBA11367]HBE58394.1 hypothetical protein [Cyanobacteria bacterium UBA11366]HBK63620.1 hypothetical protein [Cyanobacteria bacterium UBA11166]HBR73116.1 hypothetical protein [Cyanobacteria bacterium UBA11159]HBS68026.1 hypothetical protein [Cyanobacteria bacterium UBA11153]HBW88437.1 hypothetical protein [Cyanobacteria bacterium UBA11149]
MSFAVNFAVSNDWGNGFTANMSIANNGTSSLDGWILEFDAPFEITNIWNAEIVSRQGTHYIVRNLSYNSAIATGTSVSFGFNANSGSTSNVPTGYILNGVSLGAPTVLPSLSVNDVSIAEGNTGTLLAGFEVKLSQASLETVTVEYGTSNGTAVAGSDYTATSGTISFAPGETTKTIAIPVNGDLLDEFDETLTVNLANASKATIGDAQGIGTIIDNDPIPSLAVNDVTISEGNSGSKNAVFTVSLSAASGKTVTVNFATANGTATAGVDYTARSGTLTFNPGETSKTVSVPIIGDTVVEGNETFSVNLSGASNATIADTQGVATISNDDVSGLPLLSINDVTVTEGDSGSSNVTFTVSLSAASSQTVTVNFATANGSAIAISDYTATNGTLTFNPGETSKTISVAVIGDVLDENNETVRVNLSNATNATIADSQGIATITDNDPTPSFRINDVTLTEGNTGTTNATFTVSLSAASGRTTSVNFATANGSAIATSDYTATNGTLTFNPGETSKTISVAVIGDTLPEANETFSVNLSNPSNATIADNQGIGNITDNDMPQSGAFNYGEALQKSILFYEAQRSGDLPATNRLPWRGDSALNDGADVSRNLSGGYYDAGDHVKFSFPMASSMTMLSWGAIEYRNSYQQSGQLPYILDAIKWGTDYLLKSHITDANGTKEFWGQVGQGNIDHAYWGAPENMTMARPSFKIDRQKPGSDLAGEAAASLAAASIVFRPTDSAYADTLLANAIQLYNFADTYRGKYSDSITDAANYYNSWSGYNDELVWGAAWLYKATGNTTYLNKAENYYQQYLGGLNNSWTQSWDNKSYGAAILLSQSSNNVKYRNDVEGWLNNWSDTSGNGITYTAGGLAWISQWGSLRYSATTAFLAGVYSDTVNDYSDRYANFAEGQIDYILGDNPNNFSYMVGFGDNYPLNPHHRAASGTTYVNDPIINHHTLYGALVGGPASANDNDYQDVRNDYIRNEVALDYNAGFTGALARMYDIFGGTPLSVIPETTIGVVNP